MYCPPGFVDGEDGEGNVVSGSWRDDEGTSSMTSVGMTSSNRYVYLCGLLLVFISCHA